MTQECRGASPDNHRKALYKVCLHHKKEQLLCKLWEHLCIIEIKLAEKAFRLVQIDPSTSIDNNVS